MDPDSGFPSWLNHDFFQTLLREDENDSSLVVTKVDMCLAVGKGDNYLSVLHRVTVHITKDDKPEKRFLIVKSLPVSEMMVKFAKEGGIFEKERHMYLETFPAFNKLQEDAGTEPTRLGCKCYKTSRPYTIVMEDMTKIGYTMAKRQLGLDLNYTRVAIKALARLHALSRGLIEKDPNCLDAYPEPMYVPEKTEMCHQFLDPNTAALAGKIETWKGFERFGEKLRKIEWVDRMMEMFLKEDTKGFAVLNHGDCWVNNMMFKCSEEGEVQDVKFVDFQIARYASLAFDIHYFLYTSPKEEVRDKYWNLLLEEYYSTFVETLKSIGLDTSAVFSVAELKEEVASKILFGVLTTCSILPVVLADPEDAMDMSELVDFDSYANLEDKSSFFKVYDGKIYKRVMQNLLLHFESLGVL